MPEETSFGQWLRQRRRMLDLTQQALANQVGCARITLRRIEAGALKPSKELAHILLDKLGIPELERPRWIEFARGLSGLPTSLIDPGSSKPASNLPSSLTSFIGRKKEQAEIIKLISTHRLITLTGSGGVGKTRLSINIGEQLLGDYANGVWLVELAALSNPALLPQTVASTFGIATQSSKPPTKTLIHFLHAKTALLVMDNCEHLLDACAQITDTLLKNCPNLKILATSREPMSIMGEAVYRVPSLGLPNIQQVLEKFRDYESVLLFEERAQLAQMDFSLTIENASSITEICHRLDGIPLAIELAAAHISMFSVEQIATQLSNSFNLLTGGSRTALPRQQTIRASIEWSWNLLSDPDLIFLRSLSVFAGGFTLESAQAVCEVDALNLISVLVKKSLIMLEQESGRETRYRFHEMVRQYAHEKLVTAGEEDNIRTRHMKYFLELSELAEPALRGPTQVEWMLRLNDERDNIRTALEWANKTDVEAGMYIAGRLHGFWQSLDLREGARWLDEFIEKPESWNYLGARAKALGMLGNLVFDFGQFARACSLMQESLDLYRAGNDKAGEIDALLWLAWIIDASGHRKQSIELAQQALVLSQSLGDIRGQALALSYLGPLKTSDLKSRVGYWEKVIDMFRKVGDWRNLADHLGSLGLDLVLDGEIEAAQKYLDESTMFLQRLNNKAQWTPSKIAYSQIALMRGDYEQARAFLQDITLMTEELGGQREYLWLRVRFGYLALREGNITEARHIFAETAQNFQKDGSDRGVVFTLEGMAGLSVAVEKPEHAARLIGWTDTTREKIDYPRPLIEQTDVDKIIAACLAKMGEVAFSQAYDEGQKMTLDEALDLALNTSDEV